MRVSLAFAFGFMAGAAFFTLVNALWFDRPDPAMSTSSALQIVAFLTAIGCIASTVAFAISHGVSKRRISWLRGFAFGAISLIVTLGLAATVLLLLPPFLGSPWVLLPIALAVSAAIPWLLVSKNRTYAG